MTRKEISNAIEQARQDKGITFRKLAEISGRDLRAVQAVCKSKYNFGVDVLIDIAHAVGKEVKV